MTNQRGCKYIDADEAFRRVVRDADKQGAYLFYHKDIKMYQVIREGTMLCGRVMNDANKKRLEQNLNDKNIDCLGFYNRDDDGFDEVQLLEDIRQV